LFRPEPISGVAEAGTGFWLKPVKVGLAGVSLRRNMRMMNITANTSSRIIRIDEMALAIAPPMPKCENSAPRPRPSNAPPSTPFHMLGRFCGTWAGATGAGAGRCW
jgi:hypothetical protein